MNIVRIVLINLGIMALTACSTIAPTELGQLNEQSGAPLNGQVMSIQTIKLDAEYSKRLSGGVIGHFVSVGLGGNTGLQLLSLITGVNVANEYYGKYYDQVKVETSDEHQYTAIVPVGHFSKNENVEFTLKNNILNSIMRIK